MKKQPKSFSKVCGNIHALAAALTALEAAGILLMLLSAAGVLPGGFGGVNSIGEAILVLIWETALLVVFNYARLIFGSLKKSDTPFPTDVSRRVKAIARTLVIGGGAYFLASLILYTHLEYFTPYGGVRLDVNGLLMLTAGILIWGLAYVFSRGSELQRESDETL